MKFRKPRDTFTQYHDKRGKWRWRQTTRVPGKKKPVIIGASTQGYVNKADCLGNQKRVTGR